MTVLISIADIATDVIVLLSFYRQDRTVFFVISLCILIVSHIAYSILFLLRFDVIYDHGWIIAIFLFFATLPLGTIISFIIMFTDNKDSRLSKWLNEVTQLDMSHTIQSCLGSGTDNKKAQWMMEKLVFN